MVLPDSHQMLVSCATRDSTRVCSVFGYGPFTLSGCAFQHLHLTLHITLRSPTTPIKIAFYWFGLFRFRSPLLTKSLICFLFLRVLRCFNSPRSPHSHYVFMTGYTSKCVGCPIRISPDQSSLGSSPRLFAA
jgi:hypothetical protein